MTPTRAAISLAVLVTVTTAASAQIPLANPVPPPPAAPAPAPAQPNRVVIMQKPAAPPAAERVVLMRKPGETGAPAPQDKADNAETPKSPQEAARPKPPGNRDPLGMSRMENDEELRNRLSQELYEDAVRRWEESKQLRPGQIVPKPDRSSYSIPQVAPIVPAGTPYVTKPVRETYPAMRTLIEPDYVVHRRMYFEEKNSERYGWDLGIAQPVVSALYFYKDVLLWPAELASNPFERYDTSAGKCLPGSPVPYYLYPPEVDLFGATVGAATIVGVAAILP